MSINYGFNNIISSGNIDVSGVITATSGNFINLLVNGSSFSSSVSGLLPTVNNSGDNRILTSTGSSLGINAESNLTFDGTNLVVTSGVTASTGNFTVSVTGSLLNIDNVRLDGNTFSSTNTNGNIVIQPNGSGQIIASGFLIASTGTITTLSTTPTFVSPSALSVSEGDWNPGAGDVIRASASTTGINISGIVLGSEYTRILINIGSSNNITLKHEASSATAANRIITSTGGDHIIPPTGTVSILYDITSSRWRIL